MFTRIFTAKWIRLYGTKYISYDLCILAVDATFVDKMPVFGKLECIWLADEEILFEYTPFRTVEFDVNLMAYEVEEPESNVTEFCHFNLILDYNVYFIQRPVSGLYIPLKYDLRDIIKQHVIGENPLHF